MSFLQDMMKKKKTDKPIYFPNLNPLRFLAAFIVIIGHIELIKTLYDYPTFKKDYYFLFPDSGLAVSFFFVLSGFLITFLLLKEHEKSNTISVKKFYLRRFLRIWPLYFFILLLGFLVVPFLLDDYPGRASWEGENFSIQLLLYGLILPNVAQVLGLSVGGIQHLWSIGVEEQFYYIWPIILKRWRGNILVVLVSIVIVIAAIPHLLELGIDVFFAGENKLLEIIRKFFIQFRISAMGMGGIAAYLFYSKSEMLGIVYNQYFSWSLLILLTFAGIFHFDLPTDLYSLLFAIFILDISTNPNYPISLESKLFNYLGKISYGLYMYHWLVIILVIELIKPHIDYSVSFNCLIYALSIGLTILISAVSYEYLEKYFIKRKERFAIVKSKGG